MSKAPVPESTAAGGVKLDFSGTFEERLAAMPAVEAAAAADQGARTPREAGAARCHTNSCLRAAADLMPVRRALLSVSDKSNLVEFGKFLASKGVELLSTGGTAKALRGAGLTVLDVSEITGHPECLDGRVKTLHPKVHGGILTRRDLADHEKQCEALGIGHIDLVAVNLYPFEATVAKGGSYDDCVENIDIGGPAMVRAAAKNHAAVAIVTTAAQYEQVQAELEANDGHTTMATRKQLAAAAYARTAEYDAAVSSWFAGQLGETTCSGSVTRPYTKELDLKYGCNPHQSDAAIFSLTGSKLPFSVVNGKPGYINLLDALNAFQLVVELKQKLSLPAAASFKHVSPAGAAVFVPLSDVEAKAYEVEGKELTDAAVAYVRARNADPLCSFGDFAAMSEVVDEATAMFLKTGKLAICGLLLAAQRFGLTVCCGLRRGVGRLDRARLHPRGAGHPEQEEGRQLHHPRGRHRLRLAGHRVP